MRRRGGEELDIELHAQVATRRIALLVLQREPLGSDPAPLGIAQDVSQRDLQPVCGGPHARAVSRETCTTRMSWADTTRERGREVRACPVEGSGRPCPTTCWCRTQRPRAAGPPTGRPSH